MADISTPFLSGPGSLPVERSAPWAVNYLSSDFGTLNAELKAAPTRPNSATYITHVTMGVVETASQGYVIDCKLKLIDAVGLDAFGPIQFLSDGQTTFSKDFNPPMKITDNKALDIYGRSAGKGAGYYTAAFVYIEGFTGDKPLG